MSCSDAALDEVLGAIDREHLARDITALVAIPSVTGDERRAQEWVAGTAAGYGLDVALHEEDLPALRAQPGFPGMEVERHELVTVTATLRGRERRAGRLCLNGHVDVVPQGSGQWTHGPWSGARSGGRIYGRGAVDMKGGLVAALHALAAIRSVLGAGCGEVVLQSVAGEEDGGVGTFAALRRDAAFQACLIPEPTELDIVCAQAGALTFTGRVRGRPTHASVRLEGVSAIDRYLPLHAALRAYEQELNGRVEHPLLRRFALPYPVEVGRIRAGEWSSTVPGELEFEGRLGVAVGQSVVQARAEFEAALHAGADDAGPPVEIEWTGGQFGSGATPSDHPFVTRVAEQAAAELPAPPGLTGVPYGADMRQFCERGIPTVMFGPRGLARAHATDEWVALDDLVTLARVLARVALTLPPAHAAA